MKKKKNKYRYTSTYLLIFILYYIVLRANNTIWTYKNLQMSKNVIRF